MLAQRLADILAACSQEGIGHAAADHQHVDLSHEVHEQIDLGRDLGAADDRHHGARRVAEALFQRVELGLHGPAGESREMAGQSFGRGMSAVGGGKSVVDEDVAILCLLFGKGRIVLFLALMEASILEEQDATVRQFRDCLGSDRANAIAREGDWPADDPGHRSGDRGQREFGLRPAFRPAEMR